MTDYAFKTVKFVLNKSFAVLLYGFVAARTGYVYVLSIQFKCGLVVVKSAYFPMFGLMTTLALYRTVLTELPPVYVCVAIHTLAANAGKLSVGMCFIRQVAASATLPGMRPFERKGRQLMLKMVVSPAGNLMTAFASLVRIPLFRNLSRMHILVAIHTPSTDVSEFPFFALFVARKTRSRNVPAFKRKKGNRVQLNPKTAFAEAVDRVTHRAILLVCPVRKLPLVIVRMTVRTAVVCYRVGHTLRDMALFAIHRFMFAFQRKMGFVVVEAVRISKFPK